MCVVVDIEKVSQVGIDNDVIDFVFGALHKIAILCDYSYIVWEWVHYTPTYVRTRVQHSTFLGNVHA